MDLYMMSSVTKFYHDNIIKWKSFPHLLGNPPVTDGFPLRWIPITKDLLACETIEKPVKLPMIWNAMTLMWRHSNDAAQYDLLLYH